MASNLMALRRRGYRYSWIGLGCALALTAVTVSAQEIAPKRDIQSGVSISVAPRTPAQVATFFEARGFPEAALARLRAVCFLTVTIHNRSTDVAWLELDRWRLVEATGAERPRRSRAHWERIWEELDLPQARRATFGWTQLPESRDLQPGESVGGNIAMVPPAGEFTLEARFATGAHKDGKELRIRRAQLSCPGRGEDR
jgi:hypothetical protein